MAGAAMMDGGGRGNALRPWVWGGAACLLLLPLVAMQFPGSGVAWTGMDFAVMGAMLAVGCGIYELGTWASGDRAYRAGFGLAALAGFMTVWVNLAVGMLGSEHDGANAMFAGVLAIAAVGALLARLRPAGMARAMLAAGIAQLVAVGVGASMGYLPRELALSACFALPWLASAALFRWSARQARAG